MSIIKCPHCGKSVSDNSTNCPYCSNPVKEVFRCPKCGSDDTSLEVKVKDDDAGAFVESCRAVFFGVLGSFFVNLFLSGRQTKIRWRCNSCGKRFKNK